jgi:hypothetical protein
VTYGELGSVPLRDGGPREDHDSTPWRSNNLDQLGGALGSALDTLRYAPPNTRSAGTPRHPRGGRPRTDNRDREPVRPDRRRPHRPGCRNTVEESQPWAS